MVPVLIPEGLAAYIAFQVEWAATQQTGRLELNFFQGGVTNMNIKQSLKLQSRP